MGTTKHDFSDIYRELHDKIHRYLERLVGRNHAEGLT